MIKKKTGKVLLAEDDESLRDALVLFLKSKGYTVSEAADGLAAFDMIKKSDYDLLLTDLNMPGMSGEDLLDRLDEIEPDRRPAAVVMTGHGTIDSAIKGIKAGINAYIRKPVDFLEMETAIRSTIERKLLERQLKSYYKKLDRKVEERTRELVVLNKFSALVNSSFSLEKILNDAVEEIVVSLETDAAWIYLLEGDPPVLKLYASSGLSGEFIEAASALDTKEFDSAAMYKDNASFLCKGAISSRLPIHENVLEDGFKTALHTPIQSGGIKLGTMGIASKTGRFFHDSHRQLLTSFGNNIGVAIHKIRLYEKEKATTLDLENKVNQLLVLNWMGNRSKVSKRLEDIANMLVSSISEALGLDRVCLWLYDDEGNRLYLKACHGQNVADPAQYTVDGEKVASLGIEGGESVLVSNPLCGADGSSGTSGKCVMAPLVVSDESRTELNCWEYFGCGKESCVAYMNKGLACWTLAESCNKIPGDRTLLDKMETCKKCVIYKSNTSGKNIGFICADNYSGGKAITPDDIKVLNVFSNSAAAIIENIMLMERLVKDENFIDSIITNMSSGLLVTDLDGRVRMINNAGVEILRANKESVEDALLSEIYPGMEVMSVIDSQANIGNEINVMTVDGIVPVGYTSSHLIEKGRPAGVIVLFRDLSEIQKLHEQLREREHFSAIGKVAAGVAHEIRNPLFGITSVAQILAREIKDGTPQKALLDALLSETSRLNTLVEDMLLYGRSMKISPQPVDINALVEGVLSFNKAGIKEKGLKIITEFSDELPFMMVDPGQMKQVFLNLIINAVDASGPGGEIRIITGPKSGFARIEISDKGSGIPAEDLPKVFDLFYTTKEKGTGLGLAICRKIIEDHGGMVAIRSAIGAGTSIILNIPDKRLQ